MMRRGFTIVELVITITIMGILLTLAVVNLNATQANSRDAERKADAESLALNLENFYANHNPDIPDLSGTGRRVGGGTYPSTPYMTSDQITTTLPDIDPKVLRAPGVSESEPISVTLGAAAQPSKSNDVYLYWPLTSTGHVCTTAAADCRSFTIYYYQEVEDTVKTITSRHTQ